MDYIPVSSMAILVSAVLVLSCGQTDTQTRIIAIMMRLRRRQ